LFRNPFLLVLDEPNSNLDTDGESALVAALDQARSRGAVVIVVSHKTALLSAVDFVGRVHEGRFQVITREEYRQNLIKAAQAAQNGKAGGAPQDAARSAPLSPVQTMPADVTNQVAMLRAAATAGSSSLAQKKESGQ
ncbi:MAG: hypothetical protein ACKVON_02400, partial [Beijerinckiaceae bacterium]